MKTGGLVVANSRLLVASCLGTAIEWYDFFLYALIAPLVFDRVFFPKLDIRVSTLVVWSTFTVGFIARPLGGIVFGHFGDRFGRRTVFVTTLVTMGISSTAIGVLPSYATIGLLAPTLLVSFRFLQGFALGGESIGALLLVVESVPGHQRGFYAAVIQAAGPIGIIASSAIVSLITWRSIVGFQSGLWRIPFLLSAALMLIGAYMRRNVSLRDYGSGIGIERVPIATIFKSWKHATVTSLLVCLAETAYFYLTTIFAIAYGSRVLRLSQIMLTSLFLFANCVATITVPLFGMLSDRVGRRPLIVTGLVASMCFIYPFFWLLQTRNGFLIGIAMVLSAGVVHPSMFAGEGSFIAELFDPKVRFTGACLGKQVGTVLGGGLAPMAATALLGRSTSNFLPIVIYFLAMAIPATIASVVSGETAPALLPNSGFWKSRNEV